MHSGISLALAGPADNITILRSRGRRLAKLIRANGTIEAYNSARLFDLITAPIPGLDALESALRWLTARSDCCIVRGAIVAPSRARGVRRLLHQDPDTGDRATLRDVPRRWLALDIDGLPRPDGLEAGDLPGCARIAIAGLSEAFQHVRCIVQTTASHGVAPGVRLRLWYWLSRPTGGAELQWWLRAAPVDPAVFSVGHNRHGQGAAGVCADAAVQTDHRGNPRDRAIRAVRVRGAGIRDGPGWPCPRRHPACHAARRGARPGEAGRVRGLRQSEVTVGT